MGDKPHGTYGNPALRPEAPSDLPPKELELWVRVLASMPDDHWRPSDVPLIVTYCQASVRVKQAMAEDDSKEATRYANIQIASGRALRLTPASRQRPITAARQSKRAAEVNGSKGSKGEDRDEGPTLQ